MNKKILIGISAVVAIIILIVMYMKKEKFDTNNAQESSTGLVQASGTASTTLTPLSYLTSDASGNLSTTGNGVFSSVDVEQQLTLSNYPGKEGDVIVSNGPNAPPVWASGVVSISDFNNSLKTNGYQMLPGGLIIQWGNVPSHTWSSGMVTNFPIPFPTQTLSVVASWSTTASSAAIASALTVYGITASSFQIEASYAADFTWIALGF